MASSSSTLESAGTGVERTQTCPFKKSALPLCIFLAEDNAILRTTLAEMFRDVVGEEIVGFAKGEVDALTWLIDRSQDWNIAILDLFLLEGNGLGILSGCRVRGPAQKVIVITNYATLDMRVRCLGLGADAVFDKATELEALLEYCLAVKLRHNRDNGF